jgi:hypothetical protein
MKSSLALNFIRSTCGQSDPVRARRLSGMMLHHDAFDGMESLIAGYHSIFDRMPKDNHGCACQRPYTETEDA